MWKVTIGNCNPAKWDPAHFQSRNLVLRIVARGIQADLAKYSVNEKINLFFVDNCDLTNILYRNNELLKCSKLFILFRKETNKKSLVVSKSTVPFCSRRIKLIKILQNIIYLSKEWV